MSEDKLLEYFNSQSTLKYIAGVVSLGAIPLFNTNLKETIFVVFFSLMLIFFGIYEAYTIQKNEIKKEISDE